MTRPEYKHPLQQQISNCTRCSLRKLYSGPVPIQLVQEGFLCIGEAPGSEEDTLGIPFIGPSGRYLRMKLKEAGYPLSRVSFCNSISCRPHDNRDPSKHELYRCRVNLLAQISTANPRVILVLGKVALTNIYPHGVLKNDRGKPLFYGIVGGKNRWIMPTYHPAGVLRNKKDLLHLFEEDIKKALNWVKQKPTIPAECKVCLSPVYAYDEMAGAWCQKHFKPVPRSIWQDELPGMEMV